VGVGATDGAVEGQLELVGGGLGRGERHPEDGVGAEVPLVGGAVTVDHPAVELTLIEALEADDQLADGPVDVGHSRADALSAVAVAAIAQLDGFELPGRGPGGNDGTAPGPGCEEDLHLDRRVPTRIQDLTAHDLFDGAHVP